MYLHAHALFVSKKAILHVKHFSKIFSGVWFDTNFFSSKPLRPVTQPPESLVPKIR